MKLVGKSGWGGVGPPAQPLENGEHCLDRKTASPGHVASSQLQAAIVGRAPPPSLPFMITLSLHPAFLRTVLVPPKSQSPQAHLRLCLPLPPP